jgi:hypothetical protein
VSSKATRTTRTQLYVIAPDGGEARRAAEVATGVEAFRWCPDGAAGLRELGLARTEGQQGAGEGTRNSRTQGNRLRHQRVAVPPLGPQPADGPRAAPARAGPGPRGHGRHGQGARPVRRHALRAERVRPGRRPLRRLARRPHAWCLPSTRRPRSAATAALRWPRWTCAAARCATSRSDAGWDFSAPRYSPDGQRVAFTASHQAVQAHHAHQLAVWEREAGDWDVVSAEWDHEVHAPLHWEDDGQALLFTAAEQKGRNHLWRFDLPDRRAEVVVAGGWVSAFDKAAGTLVTLADRPHPAGCTPTCRASRAARRIETFNDSLMATLATGQGRRGLVKGARCHGRTKATTCRCGWSTHRASTRRRSTRCCTTSTAARTPARRQLALPLEHKPLRRRVTSWPASTTTAPAASATPSRTASRTAGANWNCRTSKPAPTGC